MGLLHNSFLTASNLNVILLQVSTNALLAVGATFVILTAGIDLSVGSIVGLSGVVGALLAQADGPVAATIAIAGGVLTGAVIGAINGFLVSIAKVPAFVATLGTMTIALGIAYVLSNGSPISGLSDEFLSLGQLTVFGVQLPIVAMLVTLFLSFLALTKTRFGLQVYAVGGNVQAARIAGVNVRRILFSVYTISGTLAGAAGVILAARVTAGIPVIATNMRIDPPASSMLKAYVGPNDVGAGEGAAKAVVNALEGKGGVVVLQGPIGQSAETDRTQGVKNILAKSPEIKLLAIQPANWDRTQAYNLMQDWISRYGSDVKGVIAENDDMAIGAIRALQEKGLAGKIPVGGVDAIKDGLREIKSGNLVATNLQNAAIELGMALQATVDLLDNRPVPQTALLNMPVIKKDKVDYYYDQLYVKPQDFLKTLPDLVKRNLASRDYASQ